MVKLEFCKFGKIHVPNDVKEAVKRGEKITANILPQTSGIAKNVLKHGTGGINIDASRIVTTDKLSGSGSAPLKHGGQNSRPFHESATPLGCNQNAQGRFPANLILSHNPDCVEVGTKKVKPQTGVRKKNNSQGAGEGMFAGGLHDSTTDYVNPDGTETVSAFECTDGCPVMELDRQSGPCKTGNIKAGTLQGFGNSKNLYGDGVVPSEYQTDNASGASRFFKCFARGGAKALNGTNFLYCAKASKKDKGSDNTHPTVKSSALMSYLINMITPPEGTVLDPFLGSGTTGVSAVKNGFKFIGIEQNQEYIQIAEKRIYHHFPEFKKEIK